MSTTSKGNSAEERFDTIMGHLGFRIVAKAKRSPVWRNGVVVGNDGNVDLLEGALDRVYMKRGRRPVLVQVTYVGNESPRRKALREADIDPAFWETWLVAFEPEERAGSFRVFLDVDDYLERGHRLTPNDRIPPWELPHQQATL